MIYNKINNNGLFILSNKIINFNSVEYIELK